MCEPRVTRHTSIRYSSSCHTNLNTSASIFFTAAMIRAFRSVRSHGNGGTNTFAQFARIARCTVTTDLLVWHSNTQNDFSPGTSIFSLHTLAPPNGRNVNYDEKQLTGGRKILSCSFYLYRFRKYLSCGFPIINFCNPGVHYETPCIIVSCCVALMCKDAKDEHIQSCNTDMLAAQLSYKLPCSSLSQ